VRAGDGALAAQRAQRPSKALQGAKRRDGRTRLEALAHVLTAGSAAGRLRPGICGAAGGDGVEARALRKRRARAATASAAGARLREKSQQGACGVACERQDAVDAEGGHLRSEELTRQRRGEPAGRGGRRAGRERRAKRGAQTRKRAPAGPRKRRCGAASTAPTPVTPTCSGRAARLARSGTQRREPAGDSAQKQLPARNGRAKHAARTATAASATSTTPRIAPDCARRGERRAISPIGTTSSCQTASRLLSRVSMDARERMGDDYLGPLSGTPQARVACRDLSSRRADKLRVAFGATGSGGRCA
jgi:hypothetical protein